MDNHEIAHIFNTISSCGISIHLGKIDEAFAHLETLRHPAGTGWPQDVARGTESLFRARTLANQAETLEKSGDREAAETLWSEVSSALKAAKIPYRVQTVVPLAHGVASSDDSWPELLRFFEEYVGSRKVLYR